ncbi:hypothetical protein L218DRAFT_967755 [Marasmius fiardii PR-910]|nr:hypothetical protein L218DRAFT_967755 [Marasmius fiardii PR-910]
MAGRSTRRKETFHPTVWAKVVRNKNTLTPFAFALVILNLHVAGVYLEFRKGSTKSESFEKPECLVKYG